MRFFAVALVTLAMQKVEGSNPFRRLRGTPAIKGVFAFFGFTATDAPCSVTIPLPSPVTATPRT